jgi:hypothetical protein
MLKQLIILPVLANLPLCAVAQQEETPASAQTEEVAPHLLQLAEVIGQNPTQYNMTWRSGYISVFLKEYPQHQKVLLSRTGMHNMLGRRMIALALWMADTQESRTELEELRTYDPLAAGGLRGKQRPDFTRLENLYNGVDEANILDTAWGVYDAGNDREILASFIRCATRTGAPTEGAYEYWDIPSSGRTPTPPEAGNVDIVAMAAKWSILSRSEQSQAFAAEVETCLQKMPSDVQERFRSPLPQYGPNEHEYDADDTE